MPSSKRERARRLEALEDRLPELDGEGWREAYGLEPTASRGDAWIAELEGRGDETAWLRFLADGFGRTSAAAKKELAEVD